MQDLTTQLAAMPSELQLNIFKHVAASHATVEISRKINIGTLVSDMLPPVMHKNNDLRVAMRESVQKHCTFHFDPTKVKAKEIQPDLLLNLRHIDIVLPGSQSTNEPFVTKDLPAITTTMPSLRTLRVVMWVPDMFRRCIKDFTDIERLQFMNYTYMEASIKLLQKMSPRLEKWIHFGENPIYCKTIATFRSITEKPIAVDELARAAMLFPGENYFHINDLVR